MDSGDIWLYIGLYTENIVQYLYLNNRHSTDMAVSCLVYPPYECTYGGYYGFVVTPPRPQTYLCERDNLKNSEQIASIFYMSIDIGERIAGKQDRPGPIIFGPPRAPWIAKNAHFCILWPIYEKLAVIFFPCYTYVCSVMKSYCPEIFVHLGST